MAQSPLTRGLMAGLQVANTINSNSRQKKADARQEKLDARADEEYEGQQKFREAVSSTTQAYNAKEGDFADAPPVMIPEQPVQPNMGLRTPQQVESAVGQPTMTQPGLAQAADPGKRDQLYYERMRAAAQFLPPEKALAWQANLNTLQEQQYLTERKNMFRGLENGDKESLKKLAPLYNKYYPDGGSMDISQATFDPNTGTWNNLVSKDKTGKTQAFSIDRKMREQMYVRSDLDTAIAYGFKIREEGRADATAARADKGLQLQEQESNRADRRLNADIANQGAARAQGAAGLDLQRQRLELERAAQDGSEKARDVLQRQQLFADEFIPKIKDDPYSPTREGDQEKSQTGQQKAGMATTIYSLSAEGAAPGKRSAIAGFSAQFIRDFYSDKLDEKKFVDNGDGTHTYDGKIKVPSSMAPPPPKGKPGLQTGGAQGGF